VALSLLAITLPRPQLELGAAVAVVLSSASGISASSDQSVALATHLTLAGGAVTISSLVHRDHRDLGWLGGFLLAAATWVRLYDVGVRAPEAYTLPTAVALVLVGLHRLHRDADADTSTSLLPGLSLATLPTLLWALADPLSTRAVVIGLAALALLLGGAALRWTAPVLVGWVCGGLLVLRELAPYAAQTPQWILIGAAGTLLVATGITWESRMRDLRHAAGYLAHLR
jgi:acyl dehydratase